jgi:hypothetical protein
VYSEHLTKEALNGFEDFKTEVPVICTVRYANKIVLLAKEEAMLQDIIERLTASGRCYGMEMNVEKTKVKGISRQPFQIQIVINHKRLGNVEYFNYLCSRITNDARCTWEIKSRTATGKAAFNKKTLFTSKLVSNLRKKLVNCYMWSIALYGAETWTIWKENQKYLESIEVWVWRRMDKISWTDHMKK